MSQVQHSQINHPIPKATPGFEGINRYWDKKMQLPAAKILPGELYVSTQGEMIVTVLGSCISTCIRDRELGIGGMNHFMLPVQGKHSGNWGGDAASSATRYGNWAMEYLINAILKLGGEKNNFEVKVFGGGKVLANATDVGRNNIDFVKEYLESEMLLTVATDVGGIYPRKVLYFPDTGKVKMRRLIHVNNATINEREIVYQKTLDTAPKEGDIELF
ncbi:MAG: chemoreceptor glutamine deamidase CheD [Pseudomonadales bacterium]|nr:chemoreceptor glutamine deamidase CheD [Pseudomonadales bacterium]